MDHVPIELRSRGPWPLPPGPLVTIVGARRPTPYGEAVAERLAQDLARHGVTLVGGLSRGIETVAHRAALDAGVRTVAVLGTGVDVVYPAAQAELADRILSAGGTLLSAFPDGTRPRAANFPRRNWTMACQADVVVVVEAAANSIALTTAEAARALDKPVMVVPGSIFSTLSVGCHQLIRGGAGLVQTSADILSALPLDRPTPASLNREDFRARLINATSLCKAAHQRLVNDQAHPGSQTPDPDGRTPAEVYHYWDGVVSAYAAMQRELDVRGSRS